MPAKHASAGSCATQQRLPAAGNPSGQAGSRHHRSFLQTRTSASLVESFVSVYPEGGEMRRVFYYAPVATDELNRRFGEQFHVGAASNKVLGVCSALKEVGIIPIIVSGLIPCSVFTIRDWTIFTRVQNVCYIKIFTTGIGWVRRLVATLSFLMISILYVRRQDDVIFYNFFPEYIISALYFRLIGRPAILDIEDAPRKDQRSIKSLLFAICYPLLKALCSNTYLTVSRSLGKQLMLGRFLPVYGVASYFDNADDPPERFQGEYVKVLFGGAIMRETGLDLFTGAVRYLAATEPDLPIRFFITGIFPKTEMLAFAASIEASSRFRVSVYSDLSAADYRKLARNMDIGLCLKLPSNSIGQTTFPSKVIEYAAFGMLVCSTSVSDIPYIFDDDTGIVLSSEQPEELAAALSDSVIKRDRAAARARNGRARLLRRFSKTNVGREIAEFIHG
jgi:glycosyltransferase involved in cell wall biosynthesis